MLTQCAIVIQRLPQALELQTTRPVACARCEQGRGCGGGIFGLLAGGQQSQVLRLPMANPEHFTPGHRVTVALPGRALLMLATVVYGVPLIALLVGAWLGEQFGSSVGSTAALPALLGASAMLIVTVLVLAKNAQQLQAHLLLNQLEVIHGNDPQE